METDYSTMPEIDLSCVALFTAADVEDLIRVRLDRLVGLVAISNESDAVTSS